MLIIAQLLLDQDLRILFLTLIKYFIFVFGWYKLKNKT